MEKRVWGEYKGEDVILYTLNSGKYRLSVMTKGASICYYGTKEYNAVLSYETFSEYLLSSDYRSQVVGPVANRIKGASFSVDGKTYKTDRNFHSLHTLHSGSANWGDKNWKKEEETTFHYPPFDTPRDGESESITLSLKTTDGDGGFPGDHNAKVTYTLFSSGDLLIHYNVVSNQKCPIALTNHAYFVLDDRSVDFLNLLIPAEEYIEVDSEHLIPLSDNPLSVINTDYDFRNGEIIGKRRNGKYDNTWLLEPSARVLLRGNRAQLSIQTTEPGLQVYTGEFLSSPFSGIALETGRAPDTPNRPDFPSAYTDKGKPYDSFTLYKLEVK